MRERLMALEEANSPIRVAIIGCGRFGSMMAAQILRAPGMHLAVACDLDPQRAIDSLQRAGYDIDGMTAGGRLSEANDAIARRKPVATDNIEIAVRADVDVVVEATGNPDAGARHAFEAIMAEKHVVMVNVEADVLVGPILKRMADSAGVVYSLAYGDQPAVIEELYDWATSLGFEVVAAGKGTKFLPEYRKGTPDDALMRYGYSPQEAAAGDLNPQMYNSFLDGTKSAVEMCAVANMTGLVPDVPAMHFPPVSIEELPATLIPAEDGGILSRKGVVEVVSSLRRDGTEVPPLPSMGRFRGDYQRQPVPAWVPGGVRRRHGPLRHVRCDVPALPPGGDGGAGFHRQGPFSTARPRAPLTGRWGRWWRSPSAQ